MAGEKMVDGKRTAIERGQFNGRPTVSVWEVDPAGNKVGKAPIVSFGITKAKAIAQYQDEIKQFLKDNGHTAE